MIDIFQPTPTEHTARTQSFARYALCVAMGVALLAGCAAERPLRTPDVGTAARAGLPPAAVTLPVAVPSRISDALAEPAPPVAPPLPEPKLDLLVNNAQAREVFLAIVADTRYSMLMHPDVTGTLSVTLRGVTVAEALEAIRDVYGYDFKIEGRRITVYAPTLQTRIFTVNYPNSPRVGNSELRVSGGATSQSSGSPGYPGSSSTTSSTTTTPASGTNQQSDGSRVSTSSKTDFWTELTAAVHGLIGSGTGRSVVTSPQAGIMAVRAMPDELRQVEKFLKAAQIAVERQVMLEAKIIEVELRDGFQSGIDWSALKNAGGATGAMGVIGGNTNSPLSSPSTPSSTTTLPTTTTTITSSNTLVRGVQSNLPGFASGAALVDGVSLPSAGSGLFGLALATNGFQAVLGFLETRGDVQVLSSPRIATMNNQKAVLKVGSEESFINGFDPGYAGSVSSNATVSTPKFERFFSGISLDVTPQIDDGNNITLHVHPSVTNVTTKNLIFNNGTGSDSSIPTASSSVNESDTVVRIQDGNIVAIGGLMQIESNRTSSGLPGASDVPVFSSIFGNKANSGRKREVVVLIKPSIIRTALDWEEQTRRTRAALDDMDTARARVVRIDGTVVNAKPNSLAK